jgi:hypothetical protein
LGRLARRTCATRAALSFCEQAMIYKVKIDAPPINEEVTTSADSEEQARVDALNSAIQRQIAASKVTVERVQ